MDLIDVTFDEREDSKGISFCNSRIVFKDPNLLDEAVCPNPNPIQSAYTYVHQVTFFTAKCNLQYASIILEETIDGLTRSALDM